MAAMGNRTGMRVLVTGGTGAFGRYVASALLDVPALRPVFLVRAPDATAARARIAEAVAFVRASAGLRAAPAIEAIPADLADPAGLRAAARDAGALLHMAADTNFDGDCEINVEGTRAAIDLCLAREIPLFHVSTAFVIGEDPGPLPEGPLLAAPRSRNGYERSKWEAERLIEGARPRLRATVFRPSIVFADARSGGAPEFANLFRYIRALDVLRDEVEHARAEEPELRIRLPAPADGRFDLVPADVIADLVAGIVADPRLHGGHYNLTLAEPVPHTTLNEWIVRAVGFPEGVLVFDGTAQNGTGARFERALRARVAGFLAYAGDRKRFENARMREAARALGLPVPRIDEAYIRKAVRFCREAGRPRGRRAR